MSEYINFRVDGHVAELMLDRPDKLHALNVDMLNTLAEHVQDIDRNHESRVLVITSTGDRSFCCGEDIIEWAAMSPVEMWRTWIKPRPQNRVQRHVHHGRPQPGDEDRSLHVRNEGKVRKFVDQVEHVTFSGRHARERGQNVKVVTEQCVLQLDADGWIVTEIAPGVDFDRDVQARCEFRLPRISELRSMDPSLFAPEPINLKLQPAT